MSNRNWANGRAFYAMHVKPVMIDCNFIVDSTNGNGLGIRSLKGPCVQNVFMHTTATPGAGNSNPATPNVVVTNPNPASGIIVVQMQDNYNRSFNGYNALVSPLSGTNVAVASTTLTAGAAYTITSVGTTPASEWAALGLPIGVTPNPGASFIATGAAHSSDGTTGQVQTASTTGIFQFETIGDPNQSIAPNPTANQGFGAQFIIQCLNASGTPTAPANGSVISLQFYLSDSSIQISGE
jgi:hypothetical protein